MRLIFERPGVDRTALSTAVKRTNAAISNIVNELIQANLIVEGQATHAVVQPGRRRVGLKIHPPGGYVLGVSAIATNSSIVLADIGGQRIEEVKEKTKEELKKNVSDWLLEQDSHGWRKRWDLVLDLSAPQLIIPEHFVDKEATLLILDFGTLHVDNGLSPQSNPKAEPAKSPTTLGIPAQNRPFPHGEVEEDEDDEGIYVLLQFQCFFYLTVDIFFS